MQVLTNLNLNKNEVQNMVLQNLSVAPADPKEGQMYYNTTDNQAYQYKGQEKGWEPIGAPYELPIATAENLGGVKVGAGLAINSRTGVLSATGGGVADAVDWANVTSKPFDELNTDEIEVSGTEKNKKLGIKAIPQSKVTGLEEALESKISEVKKNGEVVPSTKGSVDIEVPTRVGQLQNDSNFITSVQAPVQSVNGDTGAVTVSPASIGAVPTERTINAKPLTDNIILAADDVEALPKAGGTMTGAIDMSSHKISNLLAGSSDNDAVTKKQMETAISALGTVFNFKGAKSKKENLPEDGNLIGDVWYVENEKVGYIWIKDSTSQGRWEQLGPTVDLSGYLTKEGLLSTTGNEAKNAMSQKATTEALALKADKKVVEEALSKKADSTTVTTALGKKADASTVESSLEKKAEKSTVDAIPIVKITTPGKIENTGTSVTVSFTGTFLAAFAKNNSGEIVIVDTTVGSNQVIFETAEPAKSTISCYVVYM